MKTSRKILAALLVSLCSALPIANAQSQSDVPLLVLRYNQPHIYYDKQLFSAVSKAVAIKPTVTFSLVSFVPAVGGEAMEAAANSHATTLVKKLQGMGIPAGHIKVSQQRVDDAKYHEIYLYVD